MQIRKIVIIWIAVISYASLASAQSFEYHPKLNLSLGYGINIKDLEDGKSFTPFTTPIRSRFENPNGVVSTTFDMSLILDESELNKSYKMDANVSARYMGFNASAHYGINKSEIVNEKALTILISGENYYGRDILDMKLSDISTEAKDLLRENRFDEFINQYGNFIVNKVDRTSRVNIYLTLQSMEKSSKEAIVKSARGGGGAGNFSGSVSVSINSEISKAQTNRTYKFSIQSNGDSTGFKALRNLLDLAVSSTDPITTITKVIKDYLNQFDKKNSPISKYYLSSMTSFGVPKSRIGWNPSTENYLQEMSQKYSEASKQRDQIEGIKGSPTFKAISPEADKQVLETEYSAIKVFLETLLERKDGCLGECATNVRTCCSVQDLVIPNAPTLARYDRLMKRFTYEATQTKFAGRAEEYILMDFEDENVNGKRARIEILFFAVPVVNETTIEDYFYYARGGPIPQIALKVNGNIVQATFTNKIPASIPVVIADQAGNVTGYTNMMMFSVDDIPISENRLKVSLVVVDIPNAPINRLVKFHPGMSYNSILK